MNETTKTPLQLNTPDAYEAAYLDATRFPPTTQGNLSLHYKKMIHVLNMDDLRRLREEETPLTPKQEAIAKEFEEKAKLSQTLASPPSV